MAYPVVIVLMVVISLANSQGEVLDDPGLERTFSSSNWYCNGGCVATRSSDSHSGQYSAHISHRTQSWNGPLQSLNIDADAAVGIAYHISAFVKILQTQTNQPSVAWLSISMVYTLQGGSKRYKKPQIVRNISPSNGWVNLAATYTIEDFGQTLTSLAVYLEGPNAGIEFLVDTMSITRAQILNNPGFEDQLNGNTNWYCSGCTLSLDSDSYEGNMAVLAAARTQTWHGPSQNLQVSNPNSLVGKAYYCSAYVKLLVSNTDQSAQSFIMTMLYRLQDGSSQWKRIAAVSGVTSSDGWTELAADYLIENFGQPLTFMNIIVEGPASGIIFLADSFTMTEIQTGPIWKQQAHARIELIRKGNLNINVVSSSTQNGINIKIEQLKHEFAFGSAVYTTVLTNNAAYRQWYLDNFDWAVFEAELKWRQTEGAEGQFTWEKSETALLVLEANGKTTRGHNILWADKRYNPGWVQNITDSSEMYNKCMKRVDDILNKFQNRFAHWDVNNEMLHFNHYESVYGSPQIRYDMYERARLRDPNAKLYLNDFNVVAVGLETNRYVKQAEEFLAAGAPVDGIGVQSHLRGNIQAGILLNRLDRIATAGLPIFVTELDYVNANVGMRAQTLEDALTAYFSHSAVEGVMFWGFWDGQQWIGDASLVDGPNMTPNAAGQMWQRLYHTDWRSNKNVIIGTISAGATQTSSERVFYGDYKISVESSSGVTLAEQTVSLRKASGQLTVNIAI